MTNVLHRFRNASNQSIAKDFCAKPHFYWNQTNVTRKNDEIPKNSDV